MRIGVRIGIGIDGYDGPGVLQAGEGVRYKFSACTSVSGELRASRKTGKNLPYSQERTTAL
jgi:hypothetical protein